MALDVDPAAAERHYRALVGMVAPTRRRWSWTWPIPSPSLGWAERERPGLLERANADLILALALVHHLAIGRNVPLPMVFDLFAALAPEADRGVGAAGGPDGAAHAGRPRRHLRPLHRARLPGGRWAAASRSWPACRSRAARASCTTFGAAATAGGRPAPGRAATGRPSASAGGCVGPALDERRDRPRSRLRCAPVR